MSYIVTNKDIPQGCVTCPHGRFTESHIMYCELMMREPSEKEKNVDDFYGYIDGDNFNYCPNCGAKMDGGYNE